MKTHWLNEMRATQLAKKHKHDRGRYWFLVGVLMVFVVILMGRTAHLYLFEGDFLRGEGNKRFLRTQELAAHRGVITDRHGEILAVSTPVVSIWCNPSAIALVSTRDAIGVATGADG